MLTSGGVTDLPEHLARINDRRTVLRAAQERIGELDEQRRGSGLKTACQLPMGDPDSRVMPNKEGGYCFNYTPTAITDGAHGCILDCDVLNTVNEGSQLVAAVDRVTRDYGKPEVMLTDSGNNSGENLQAMAAREITIYTPMKSTEPSVESPVRQGKDRMALVLDRL